jgi:hypothetical protein
MSNDDDQGEVLLSQDNDPLTGEPLMRTVRLANGLIAIDLLCPEAGKLALHLLPLPLAIRDHNGRPASRWIYRVVGDLE